MRNEVFSIIMVISIVLSMFTVLVPKVSASENMIFQDGYESYPAETFPSSGVWQLVYNGAGNQYQVITTDHSRSGSKSLQMMGQYSWSAVVVKDFSSSSNLIGFEAYLMGTPGSGPSVGFGNEAIQPWGRMYGGVCVDTVAGYIRTASQNLQACVANTWYKIHTLMDRNARTFNVWIDDQLKGSNIPEPNNPWEIQSLRFDVGWANVKNYYDDVKVFSISGPPPTAPVISSVSRVMATRLQTITISGSGFGNVWPQTFSLGDGSVDIAYGSIPSFAVIDSGKAEKTGDTSDGGENWMAGGYTCAVGLILQSWTDTRIVLGGFGTALGTNGQGIWYIDPGDPLTFYVTTSSGQATYQTRVLGHSPIFGLIYTCIRVSANPGTVYNSPQTSNIVATVTDQFGTPMPGVVVNFASTAGLLLSTRAQTDSKGKASVTLSFESTTSFASSIVSATANGACVTTTVTFIPPSPPLPLRWNTCKSFRITPDSVSLSSVLKPTIDAYNDAVWWYNQNPLVTPMQYVNINSLPSVNTYSITKASTASQEQFASDALYFFRVTPETGYDPAWLLIIEFPFEPLMNALFNQNNQAQIIVNYPFPTIPSLCPVDNTYLETTPKGYINLVCTFSTINSQGLGNNWLDRANTLLAALRAVPKISVGGACQQIIETAKETLELVGDASLNVITSDFDQTGRLNSYVLIDLFRAMDRFTALTGLYYKLFDVVLDCTISIVMGTTVVGTILSLAFLGKAILKLLDFAVEIYPLTPWGSWAHENRLYQLLETCVGIIDPVGSHDGTEIIPSFYNSTGSLVLGYDSSDNNIIYSSVDGILILFDGDWLAFLRENTSNPVSYDIRLNAVGGNGPVSYDIGILSFNQNATALRYSGMVLGGASTSIHVGITYNGTLTEQVYLNPQVYVSEAGNVFDFIATGLLSNGSLTSVARSFLVVNDSQYEMNQIDSFTFELKIAIDLAAIVPYSVYMISPNFPGGHANGVLRSDVGVVDVTPQRNWVYQGRPVNINVTVMNLGEFTEIFDVSLYYNTSMILIGTQTVNNLTPNSTEILTFVWDTTNVPFCHNYTITATVQIPFDINSSNNMLSGSVKVKIRIMGDLNGDNRVDISDLAKVSAAFGSYSLPQCTHPGWNPDADMDQNSKIDIMDVGLVSGNFGKASLP
jgi:hypothetical protein